MIKVLEHPEFSKWIKGIKDPNAKAKIAARIDKIRETGQFGQTGSAGGDIGEIKFKKGAGYRIYFLRVGTNVILLLGGGDKSTQPRDLKRVHQIRSTLEI